MSEPSRRWRPPTFARLHRVAYNVLRDPASAEDATQQALLDIWRNVPRLRDPAKYEAWSYRLLVRACYAEAKRQPTWIASEVLPPAEEPHAVDVYGGVADRDQLERGLRHLSMDHRVVLALRHLLGMTPDEVATTLNGVIFSYVGAGAGAGTEDAKAAHKAARDRAEERLRAGSTHQ